MIEIILVFLLLVCAVQAIRVQRSLASALWLAGASASAAMLLFSMGAYRIAVIELSVGAGLVTVLLVFAITLAGEEMPQRPQIPQLLTWLLAVVPAVLFGALTLRQHTQSVTGAAASAPRDLDLLVQMILVFATALTVLHLVPSPLRSSATRRGERSPTSETLGSKEKELV